VEQGSTDDIFSPPYHPYTEALLSAIPIADTSVQKKHIVLDGDIPSALNPPSGCPFQTRCPRKSQVEGNLCETDLPPMRTIGEGHQALPHSQRSTKRNKQLLCLLPEHENPLRKSVRLQKRRQLNQHQKKTLLQPECASPQSPMI
jgi:oligopeptide/dipeptide ABC transporter ATP-binding protein